MNRLPGDRLQLFGRLVDLNIPVITLVFADIVMIPGMTADHITGIE